MTNLNQLLLGRFASMESDVVDNEEQQPIADEELGTDDLGNQLDSTTLPETAMAEADEHLDDVENATADVEELNDTSESLESFLSAAQQARKTGGWTQGEAFAIQLGLDAALKRIGVSGEAMMPSLESFGRSRESSTVSVENAITDGLKKIWEAIKRTINKVVAFIRKWYLKILDGASRLKKRAEAIRKKAENTQGSAKENKVRSGVLSKLHDSSKGITIKEVQGSIEAFAEIVEGIGSVKNTSGYKDSLVTQVDVIEAVTEFKATPDGTSRATITDQDEFDKQKAAHDKASEKKAKAIERGYGFKTHDAAVAKATDAMAALIRIEIVPASKRKVEGLSNARSSLKNLKDVETWAKLKVEVGKICGGKQIEALELEGKLAITDSEELDKCVKLSSAVGKLYIVSQTDKAVEIDESKEVPTLDTGTVISLCDSVINFSDKVIDYKKGWENYERADKEILKRLDRVNGKDLDKVNDVPEIAKLIRGLARISSNIISNGKSTTSIAISTGMGISSAALQYCVVSLAQYKD